MKKFMDKIKKDRILKKYDKKRERMIRDSICNIGKIVIDEDRITCYVDQNMLDQYKRGKSFYELRLNGFNQLTEELQEEIRDLDLNREVYYVFDGIIFSGALTITSLFSHVIFKNCVFRQNIGIFWGEDITFMNNQYLNGDRSQFYGDCFFKATCVQKIHFIDEHFCRSSSVFSQKGDNFEMKVSAKEISICNTEFDTDDISLLQMNAKKLALVRSHLKSGKIIIDADQFLCSDSLISADKQVCIQNTSRDFNGMVDSYLVLYNGVSFFEAGKKKYSINQEVLALMEARKRLVSCLKRMQEDCSSLEKEKIEMVRESLQHQSVAKTLRKKSAKK